MTIYDLMQLDSMKNSRVLTSADTDDIVVSSVNVMEVPDIINWVKKGEFLMTAGYSYRNRPDEFADLIPQLAEKGLAAIGIKIHRYFEEIPKKIVDNGNKCGLTIIEISEEVVFSNVSREVIQTLLSGEYAQMSGMLDRITSLSNIILSGAGLDDYIKALSGYMSNPVVLMKENGECISAGLCGEDVYATDGEEGVSGSNSDEKQGTTTMMVGVRHYKAYYYNIVNKDDRIARLYIVEKDKEIDTADIHLIEQCSFMIGMELQSESVRLRVEMKYIDQFLQSWLLGKIESEGSFSIQSDTCHICVNRNLRYRVGIVSIKNSKSHLLRFRHHLKMYTDLYVTVIEEKLTVIFPEDLEDTYTKYIMELAEFIDSDAILCVGKTAPVYYDLWESYRDADNILNVSRRYNLSEKILHYRDTGVYSLLYLIPMGRELDEYMDLYLGPLLDYDSKHQSNMYETLKVYLDTKGNIKATAARLFMHYNTISYRLERISQILGMDISDHEVQFSLNMAIKMNDMYM